MALPAPNLDDRRFQQLVDESKRLVMRRCPEWTDHNVSDPGVTLIETFAYMTDLLLYRLNRVPDKLYIKFLELIGMRLLPPTPAAAPVTFWLSAPAEMPLTIALGTQVATLRTDVDDPLLFTTAEDLPIIPCQFQSIFTQHTGGEIMIDTTETLRLRNSFGAFQDVPAVDDSLMIALSDAVPSCAVRLEFNCTIDGVGVDPDFPPLTWEAWSGSGWEPCELDSDSTGGLNRAGSVVLHVPKSHRVGVLQEQRAGWLRARVVDVEEGVPKYSSSPQIHGLVAATIGGTVEAVHAEMILSEVLGTSEGVPGQRFRTQNFPVLAGSSPPLVETSSEQEGWQEWTAVDGFEASGEDDRHYLFDAVHGEVIFGPAVREVDGSLRQYGAVPGKDVVVRILNYTVGGGRKGNIAKGAIATLKSSIPFVAQVENRRPAVGGVDGEDIEAAKERGPILLRTRNRAVTAEDYEQLTRQAAPEVARVHCVAASDSPEAGSVKVLVVPAAPVDRNGRIRFEDLVPTTDTLQKITDRLDTARVIGTRVLIEPPLYQGVTIVGMLRSRPRADVNRIREEALQRLYEYFNPLTGGPDGRGWPWGRPVQSGDAFAVLQGIRGVDIVEDVRLFGANPVTGERGQATQKLVIDPNALVFSYEHQVRIEGA